MDLNGVEEVQLAALGGADTITVNDLTGTDLKAVDLLLDNPAPAVFGNGALDSVIVNGTSPMIWFRLAAALAMFLSPASSRR